MKLLPDSRQIQTSWSHPLVVDEVRSPRLLVKHAVLSEQPGRIGMSIAPGKKDLNGYTGSHDRDLTEDLRHLTAQFPMTVFVSLMEDFEYQRFQVSELFSAVRGQGVQVIHYPIVDVSVPPRMAPFQVLMERLYVHLSHSASILVHCKGGLGRTGLVVASLLVRLGHTADEAIALTRASRKGTIQTPAQEQWIHTYARTLGSSP